MASSKDNYATDSKLYDAYRPSYPEKFIKQIPKMIPKNRREWAIDVVCGTGTLTRQIAPFFDHVLGVDHIVGLIEQANEIKTAMKNYNITYKEFDGSKVSEIIDSVGINAREVGLVCVAEAFHYLDAEVFLKNFQETLNDGTVLLITCYTKPNLPSNEQIQQLKKKSGNEKFMSQFTAENLETNARLRLLVQQFYDKMSIFTPVDWRRLENAYEFYVPSFKKYFSKLDFQEKLEIGMTNLHDLYLEIKSSMSYNNYLKAKESSEIINSEDLLLRLINDMIKGYQNDFDPLVISSHELSHSDAQALKKIEFPYCYYYFCHYLTK